MVAELFSIDEDKVFDEMSQTIVSSEILALKITVIVEIEYTPFDYVFMTSHYCLFVLFNLDIRLNNCN